MINLKEVLSELAAKENDEFCPVGKLIIGLDEETKQAFYSALSSNASTRDIHNALIASGYKIGRDTVSAHRKNHCRCRETINEK
jgi:hypothetical protein